MEVDRQTNRSVGVHSIHCLPPNETDWPKRTFSKVIAATKRRHVCLTVNANHSLALEAGSTASADACPQRDSLTACQMKMARAKRSKDASQTRHLWVAERLRKFGRPNSD
jgi:hypothetical protein